MSYDPSILRYATVVVVEGEGLAPEGQAHILDDFLFGKCGSSPRPSTFGLVKQKSSGLVGSRASCIMIRILIRNRLLIAGSLAIEWRRAEPAGDNLIAIRLMTIHEKSPAKFGRPVESDEAEAHRKPDASNHPEHPQFHPSFAASHLSYDRGSGIKEHNSGVCTCIGLLLALT
jgi:hypothetical protein